MSFIDSNTSVVITRWKRLLIRSGLTFSFLLLILLFAVGQPVQSAPVSQGTRQFQIGDVIVSISNGDTLWYDSSGNFIGSIFQGSSNWLRGLAFDPVGQQLYVTDGNSVRLFDINANPAGTFGLVTEESYFNYEEPVGILFDQSRNTYIGQLTQAFQPLLRLNSGGGFIQGYPLDYPNYGVMGMALASDQCTFYYTSYVEEGQSVKRFNLCKNVPITPDLINGLNLSSGSIGLQVLPDGSLLVANSDEIRRIDSSTGDFIQSYDYPGENYWFVVALSPDGKTFWGAAGTRVYQFDVLNGNQIDFFDAGANTNFSQSNNVSGIAVIGEYRAAQPTPTFTPTITASATFTSTVIDTRTSTAIPTRISTSTQTNLPTDTVTAILPATGTPTLIELPYFPPAPTEYPWWRDIIVIVIGGGIVAGGTYTLIRALKPKSYSPNKSGLYQTNVKIKVHEDPGSQVVESQSSASMPQLRMRFRDGQSEYFVEENTSGRNDGGKE